MCFYREHSFLLIHKNELGRINKDFCVFSFVGLNNIKIRQITRVPFCCCIPSLDIDSLDTRG